MVITHALSSSMIIKSQGFIQLTKGFNIRGACVTVNCFHPKAHNYQPNAWSILKDLGVNVIRVSGGVEGDIVHWNIKNYPNEWAQNFEAFLTQADSHGIKVLFPEMGNSWGTLFGIVSPPQGSGPYPPTPIDEAKVMIDKLAGDNNLGRNFITDSRILGWSTSNERDISNSEVLKWNLELCDYIRSKGGKAWLSSPRDGAWGSGEDFHVIEPMLRGHVDYLERHLYELWDFQNLGKNYESFYNYYKNVLQEHMINGKGSFSIEQLILGECGIWRGYGEDCGTNGTFTDTDRQTYYRAVLNAARDVGIKNIFFHDLFAQKEGSSWTQYLSPMYSVVDVDGTFYPLVADEIKAAYRTP